MTLHWWMHWFWITRTAVVIALLLVSPNIAAPTFEPYALPLQGEQTESHDESLSPDWSTQHMSTDVWDLYRFSTTSSMNEPITSALELWPSDSPSPGEEVVDVSVSTYLPLETDTNSDVTPFVFTSANTADQLVPVQKSTTLIPKLDSEELNISGEAKSSIKSEPNNSTTNDSTVVIALKDLESKKHSYPLSVENTSSIESNNISLDTVINSFSSNSQGLDKPIVNVPRLITRDLKNGSESAHNLSSSVASHNHDSRTFVLPSLLPQIFPPNARTGKAAGYFSQPLNLHPLFISTGLPPEVNSESSSFPPSEFQGPKIISDINAGLTGDFMINDRGETDSGESDSRIVWIKPHVNRGVESDLRTTALENEERQNGDVKSSPLDDAEMGDGPYNPPESSTVIVPKTRNHGEPPVPSDDLVIHTSRAVEPDDEESSTTVTRGKEVFKVTPPLLSTSKAVNVTSQTGKPPDNVTRNGLLPPVVMNTEGNLSVASDHNTTSSVNHEAGDKNISTVHSERKHSANITHTTNEEEDETTDVPTVVPVSKRVQAPAPPGSHHGLDAASITGISLGILVFAALIGAVSFVLYRRRFLNKPQTLNDKCSNPDSSGYIDDSTLRENSEEMYSLDNDSFLNSLEAMTIQNYWTDNVKHTKL